MRRKHSDGRAVHVAVKAIMATHPPLAWPLTAKAVNAKLPPHLRRCDSDICTHMRKIRRAASALLSEQSTSVYSTAMMTANAAPTICGLFGYQMPARKDIPSGRCTICSHEERTRAELLLAGGAGLRAVGRKFEMPYHSLRRHWLNHVSQERRAQLVTGPLKPMELAQAAAEEGLSLLDYLKMVRSTLMSRFLTAAESDDRMGTANVGGRLLDCLRLTAQLTGELQRATAGTTNNIAIISSPFVADLQSMLLRTLAPFPDARRAVLEGLEELSRRAVPDTAPMLGRVIEHV